MTDNQPKAAATGNGSAKTDSPAVVSAESQSQEPAGRQLNLQWDDSALSTSYANVFNVSMTRDEVGLFFGTNLTSGVTPSNALTIKLSDRIIMTPHSTKRLMLLLQANVKAYEDRYGDIDVATAG